MDKSYDLALRHVLAYLTIGGLWYVWLNSVVMLPDLMLTVLEMNPVNPWPYCITIILIGSAISIASYFIIAKVIQNLNTSHRYYSKDFKDQEDA